MLTPEERERIAEEEALRAELRSKRTKDKLWTGCAVVFFAGLGILLLLAALMSSADSPSERALIGTRMSASGTVISTGTSSASGRAYIVIQSSDRKTIKCYTEGRFQVDSIVSVAGTVTVWSESGGSLHPCIAMYGM